MNGVIVVKVFKLLLTFNVIQTEAERRRREAGVKQAMSDETRSCVCVYVCMYVCVCGFGQYLANQGT